MISDGRHAVKFVRLPRKDGLGLQDTGLTPWPQRVRGYLFLEDKMKAVEKKSMGEEIKNDLGELSLCSEARSSEKPRTNEGN